MDRYQVYEWLLAGAAAAIGLGCGLGACGLLVMASQMGV